MATIRRNLLRTRRSVLTLESCEARVLMATAPPLGTAASFAILGGTTVTNTGASTIVGNVGVSPGTSITGFPPGVVTGGALHAGDATAVQAETDLATAYTALSAEPVDTNLPTANLGGLTLTPGVYHLNTTGQLTGTLTLDAQGDANAVFVIETGTSLTTATNSSVVLINSARARNVFWQVGSSATIGSGSAFLGNILAFTSITLDSTATIAPGRALAINGGVTMDTVSSSNVFTTPLTITPDDQTKVYGAALPTLTASYSGFVNGDTSNSLTTKPTLSTSATSNSGVGTYAINASGAVDPDYTFTYVDGSLDVTSAPLTITADNQTKVYGAALPTLMATYTGFVNGDKSTSLTTQPTLSTSATASSDVGSYAINASGAVDSNYMISYANGSLGVTTAPLTITADNQTKVYGAALPNLTASYTGFVNNDKSTSLTTQPTLSTSATASSDVGTYAINVSGAVDPNYSISYGDGSLGVTSASLTITADDQTKVYGAAVPTLTASYTGFVNGDTSNNLTTKPSLATTATASSDVGSYAIDASGAADPNYTFTYVDGSLGVTSAPLTITADNQTKVYGAALPTLTASYAGFVNGDTSASLATLPTLSTSATAGSHVSGSPYSINASGAVDPNYTISYEDGSLAVNPAPLTITADNQTKVYGAAVPTLTASYSGFVNGDTSATLGAAPNSPAVLSTTATASSTVAGSPYAISVSGAADPDYSITNVPGSLTVTSPTTTTVSGMVYLDLNTNGLLDAGEAGLAGRVVFLDLNHDGTLDAGDPTATTDASGHFTLSNTSTTSGPVDEATDQDSTNRYVVAQTVTQADGTLTIGVVPISPIAPVPVVPSPFSTNPNPDPSTAYVQSLYHAVLGRTGADSEVATWLAFMKTGMTQPQVAASFVNSLEHRVDQVHAYYEEFLDRAPDATSADWVNKLMSGVSEETVVEGFLNSAEYQASHQDSTLLIHDLYLDVLGRVGESSGVASWQAKLDAGATRQSIEADFVQSTEANDQIVQSFYASYLHRPRELGTSTDLWDTMLEAPNGSATTVAADILVSPEFVHDATTSQS